VQYALRKYPRYSVRRYRELGHGGTACNAVGSNNRNFADLETPRGPVPGEGGRRRAKVVEVACPKAGPNRTLGLASPS